MGNILENHFVRKNHVANSYHEPIYAKVINDKSPGDRDSVNLSFQGFSIAKEKTRQFAERNGFTCIGPNTWLAFAPDAERTAYISIYTEDGKLVSTNYPVHENRSVIVNKNGFIREAKYGTIWTER